MDDDARDAAEEGGDGSSPGVRGPFDTFDGPDRGAATVRGLTPKGTTGSAWSIGTTGSGKSSLAVRMARELANRTCWPMLVVDSEASMEGDFPGVFVARTPEAAMMAVWGDGRHCRWIPRHADELERVAEAAHELGRVVLLVDESSYYLHSGTSRKSSLLRLIRTHRHAKVWLLFTTQVLAGDVPQAAFGGAPSVFVFHSDVESTLDTLERRWSIDPASVKRLRAGQCLAVSTGFSTP